MVNAPSMLLGPIEKGFPGGVVPQLNVDELPKSIERTDWPAEVTNVAVPDTVKVSVRFWEDASQFPQTLLTLKVPEPGAVKSTSPETVICGPPAVGVSVIV
jgi:hypothetical protein